MFHKKLQKYLVYFLFLILTVSLLIAIVYFEQSDETANIQNFSDALWYALVTLTTVGYGDNYPVTGTGKLLGLIFILSSLGLLGYLFGNITNIIRNYMEKKKEGFYGCDFSQHFIIVGWNSFSKMVCEQVVQAGNQVAVVTSDKQNIDLIYSDFSKDQVFVLYSSLDKYDAFRKVNIDAAHVVFINLESDSDALVLSINLKKQFSRIDFVVSLTNPELKGTFLNVGVKNVVAGSEIASRLVASYIFEPDVATYTEDLISTSNSELENDMLQYKVTSDNPYLNQPFIDVFYDVRKKYKAILVGISKVNSNGGRDLLKNPADNETIALNDYLILITDGHAKKLLEKDFKVKEGYLFGTL
jgi:voltage-gated potassium channel